MHLEATVRNPFDKQNPNSYYVIKDDDYATKQDFKNDLKANGYIVKNILDNRDIYIIDNTDYPSLSYCKDKLTFFRKAAKESNTNVWDRNIKELEDIINNAMKISLNESNSNKLTLYHNTSNKNAVKIDKEGIIPGLRLSAYGKGSEGEGSGVWCSTVRGYGYGGATITFEIDANDEHIVKENNTEYMIYRTIQPEEIVDIDLVIATEIRANPNRTDGINSIVESDVPIIIDKFGKDKLLKIMQDNENKFLSPYDYNQLVHLIETGNKYCKGKIKLNEKKQNINSNKVESVHKIEEVSRNQLLAKTKSQTKSRYDRSAGYKGFSVVDIDTTSVFTTNCFRVTCRVGDYWDTVEMENILFWIQIEAEKNDNYQINAHGVRDAILQAIDGLDIRVDCTCRRFRIQNGISSYKIRL